MNILYTCSGNVFRSVFAEGYTKHLLKKYNIENVNVSSCGTIAEESFKIPKSIKELFKFYNIKEKDISNHIPKRINEELLKNADVVLVMDKTHIEFIEKNFPEFRSKTFLLKEYAGFLDKTEIFDPIGQPESVYFSTALDIKISVEALIKKFFNVNFL